MGKKKDKKMTNSTVLTGEIDRKSRDLSNFKFWAFLSGLVCLLAAPFIGLLLCGVKLRGSIGEIIDNILDAYYFGELDATMMASGFGIAFIVGLIVIAYLYMDYVKKRNSRPDEEHGDASFMTPKDMVTFNQNFLFDPKVCQAAGEKVTTKFNEAELKTTCVETKHSDEAFRQCFLASQILGQNVYLNMNTKFINRNTNTITVGGSGQGKSYSELFPNALNANCNYIFTDPSGEIYQKVGKFLRDQCGYELKVFNVDEFNLSMKYNPIAYVKTDRDYTVMVDALIDNLSMGKAKNGNDFFDKASKSLIISLVALLRELYPVLPIPDDATDEEREALEKQNEFNETMQTLSNVTQLLRMAEQEVDEDGNVTSTLDDMFSKLEQVNPRSFAARTYRDFRVGGPKVCNEIIISASAELGRFWNNDDIAWLTAYDELHLEDLASEKKCALFLIIPQSTKSYNFLVSMVYSQLFDITTKAGKKWRDDHHLENPALPRHLSFWLDEFANCGKIPSFLELLSVVRKYNISINIILQGLAQLKGMYKEGEWEVILANLDTMIYLGGMEPSTIKWLSEKLGKETIKQFNYSIGKQGSLSYSNMGKNLLSPDQIEKMSRSNELIFISGCKPIQTKKYNLSEHPNFKYCGEADPANNLSLNDEYGENEVDYGALGATTLTAEMLEKYDFKNLYLKKGLKRGEIKEDPKKKKKDEQGNENAQEVDEKTQREIDKETRRIAADKTLSDDEKKRRIKELREMKNNQNQSIRRTIERFDFTTAETYENFIPEHEFGATDFDLDMSEFNLDSFPADEVPA